MKVACSADAVAVFHEKRADGIIVVFRLAVVAWSENGDALVIVPGAARLQTLEHAMPEMSQYVFIGIDCVI